MSTTERLPVRLGKSPLAEALFELRFSAQMPASNILAGHLYTRLGCSNFERLPHADIPDQIRAMDPNFMYVPTMRIKWDEYYINIGDRSIVISNVYPYKGWANFKSAITTLLNSCSDASIITTAERFSLKYIDIFDMPGFSVEGDGFTFGIQAPDVNINHNSTHMRFEINQDDQLHIVQYFAQAHGMLADGTQKTGIMLDVDSIEDLKSFDFKKLLFNIDERLNTLHQSHKQIFFKLISNSGLEALEPGYE